MMRRAQDSSSFARAARSFGLTGAGREQPLARRIERAWRWPTLLALLLTVPAFYAEILPGGSSGLPTAAYLGAAAVLGLALSHIAWATGDQARHIRANPSDLLLLIGLLGAALLPNSHDSPTALVLRLGVAGLTLLRMIWTLKQLISHGSLAYLLLVALLVLGSCGLGFWWLEPTTPTLTDGLWLAFTTAATVGYGDVVPTTPASKIFSVFVVLLGYGVLTLVTATIAASWIETEERRIEREILRDMRREMNGLRHEMAALREALGQARAAARQAPRDEP